MYIKILFKNYVKVVDEKKSRSYINLLCTSYFSFFYYLSNVFIRILLTIKTYRQIILNFKNNF